MSKNIWRPLNTYGLITIGAIVFTSLVYVIVQL